MAKGENIYCRHDMIKVLEDIKYKNRFKTVGDSVEMLYKHYKATGGLNKNGND